MDDYDEAVSRPSHYTWHPSGVECKTISMHFSHPIGAAIEYLWRAGRKGDHHQHMQDLNKARECIAIEMERLAMLRGNQERDVEHSEPPPPPPPRIRDMPKMSPENWMQLAEARARARLDGESGDD